MTKNEKKLRLRVDEVVQCMTYELVCKCCELADSLGFTWRSGSRYLESSGWVELGQDTVYNFHSGSAGLRSPTGRKTMISAKEWLNRHGIFVFGQLVLVRDKGEGLGWKHRYYLFPPCHVADQSVLGLMTHPRSDSLTITSWDLIKSPYPEWVDEEDHVITIDGKEVTLSEESYEELKKAIS